MRTEIAAMSGSSGFIGSHLTEALLTRGLKVVPISQEVLYSPKDLKTFFEVEKPDYIFHLAAYGNMSNQKDMAMIVFANLIGTFNMLKESLGINYKAFLNFGSSSEYGKKFEAMKEDDLLKPNTLYGATKAGGTHLAYAFSHQFNKPIMTIRPFSVYGPKEADFRFIPTVIRSMVTNKVFQLDDKAVHDWIYVDDFIEGVFLVMDKGPRMGELAKIVNIGSGKMTTNKEVCELLKKVAGKQYLAIPVPHMREDSSADVWLSDNHLISTMGFFPKHTLTEGLRKTFEYYEPRYRISK